ncbi:TetR/AcrR family transcriptional regulator [Streptomyces sp. NPDC013161]|uniref:TetR/AcrR family transcriptional regulator n=1 Tax=Streptomyces sp. NPDC013161 TaxID=3364862 RepID=UPI003679E9C3
MTSSPSEIPSDAPKTRKVQQRTIDGKSRIITAGAKEFIANGYWGTSANDIIAGAESNKNFFYTHFPKGKQDVAREISFNSTWDGLKSQPLMVQEMVDIGMILSHRVRTEARILAALRLSFEPGATEEYGTPWPQWVEFNITQIETAIERGEIRPHVNPGEQARQLPGLWSGLILTAGVLDGSYERVEEYVATGYKNLMKAIGSPGVLPDIDFSVNRGEVLYTTWLNEQEKALQDSPTE